MKKFANKELCEIFGAAINYVLFNACTISVEDDPKNSARYRIIFNGFPIYPQNDGVVVFCVPKNMLVSVNGDVKINPFPQSACALYGGKSKDTETALLHCNIFDSGQPCWGRAPNDTVNDLASWLVMTMLRNNITDGSMQSKATQKMGSDQKAVKAKHKQIREHLIKVLGADTVDIDSVIATRAFEQKFMQLLREG